MQPRSSLSTRSDGTDLNLNGWSDVDIDWDLPLEGFSLAASDLDTGLRLDTRAPGIPGIPAPISSPGHLEYENHSHRGPATHPAGQDELSTRALSSATPSTSTTFATSMSVAGTTNTGITSFDGPPLPKMPASSGHTAGGNDPDILTMLPSPDEETREGDEQLTNLASWADKVTRLNVQFTQHLQSIPRVSPENLHGDSETDDGAIPPPSRSHNSNHTFHLSETFIDILSNMCSKLPSSQASTATTKKDSPTVFQSLDEASYLLVFSTYLRLLETHDTVFHYLLACLEHKRESTGAGSCFYLPKLSIGSFSLATTSATRPLLFVNLMESMLARARNLVHHITSNKSRLGKSGSQGCFGGLPPIIEPSIALQAIRTREAAIFNSIERIKAKLSQLG